MLATLPIAAVLAATMIAPSSAAACPSGGYCTDSEGVYQLVPPFPSTGEFHDCVWDLHADWGDGNSTDYKFEAEKGSPGSHAYPHFGKYVATITVSNGFHKETPGKSCPGEKESYGVYWQSLQEIAEEEAILQAEKEAKEKQEAEEKAAKEAKKQQERKEREARERAAEEKFGGGSGPEGSSGDRSQAGQAVYWQACRGRIQVHAVGCPKARKVIGRARRKNLFEEGPQEILGFTCHLTGTRPAQISCRRGKSRILGPL